MQEIVFKRQQISFLITQVHSLVLDMDKDISGMSLINNWFISFPFPHLLFIVKVSSGLLDNLATNKRKVILFRFISNRNNGQDSTLRRLRTSTHVHMTSFCAMEW